MILYRIRDKRSGQFFGGLAYPWIAQGHEIWNDKGAFYRDIDTVAAWLKIITGDWYNKIRKMGLKNTWSSKKIAASIGKYDRKKLDHYEIVVNTVTSNSRKIIQAKDLLK
jgi:hypothetical protein